MLSKLMGVGGSDNLIRFEATSLGFRTETSPLNICDVYLKLFVVVSFKESINRETLLHLIVLFGDLVYS